MFFRRRPLLYEGNGYSTLTARGQTIYREELALSEISRNKYLNARLCRVLYRNKIVPREFTAASYRNKICQACLRVYPLETSLNPSTAKALNTRGVRMPKFHASGDMDCSRESRAVRPKVRGRGGKGWSRRVKHQEDISGFFGHGDGFSLGSTTNEEEEEEEMEEKEEEDEKKKNRRDQYGSTGYTRSQLLANQPPPAATLIPGRLRRKAKSTGDAGADRTGYEGCQATFRSLIDHRHGPRPSETIPPPPPPPLLPPPPPSVSSARYHHVAALSAFHTARRCCMPRVRITTVGRRPAAVTMFYGSA